MTAPKAFCTCLLLLTGSLEYTSAARKIGSAEPAHPVGAKATKSTLRAASEQPATASTADVLATVTNVSATPQVPATPQVAATEATAATPQGPATTSQVPAATKEVPNTEVPAATTEMPVTDIQVATPQVPVTAQMSATAEDPTATPAAAATEAQAAAKAPAATPNTPAETTETPATGDKPTMPAAPKATYLVWLPHKDAKGLWHPADTSAVDWDQVSLTDMPPVEIFMEIAMSSPYPMPNIPMETLINNTLKDQLGGKIPENANDWLQLLQGAGDYVANTLPTFLVKLLPNITLEGKEINLAADAAKLLQLLPKADYTTFNGTGMPALQFPTLEEAAQTLDLPPVPAGVSQGVTVTVDILKKLPVMLQKVGSLVSIDQPLPSLDDLINDDGTFMPVVDISKVLKDTLNISLPALPPPPSVSEVVGHITEAIPQVVSQLGVNTTGIIFPNVSAVESVLKAANGNDLFITDDLGRLDLVATLADLPNKLPDLAKVVEALPPPPAGWPALDDVIKQVSKLMNI